MCVRIRALVLYVSAKWALPPVSLTVFKVLPCEYSTTDSEAALSGGDFEGKTRFFFSFRAYFPRSRPLFAFEPGLSHPAALSDFLLLLLLLLRLSTTATVGGGGQESVPVAYGFPLC